MLDELVAQPQADGDKGADRRGQEEGHAHHGSADDTVVRGVEGGCGSDQVARDARREHALQLDVACAVYKAADKGQNGNRVVIGEQAEQRGGWG